ncbi:MAG: cysteine desulfurase [Clostridia bacterium]|nr:cysteine desulfurase [Clostridia bacterium]
MIYFDNSATTKMSDAALSAFADAARGLYGNPSSRHSLGTDAAAAVKAAKAEILRAIDARAGLLVLTGSGSEANNLALLGRAAAKERYKKTHARIIVGAGEHPSVSLPISRLAAEGFDIVEIPTRGGVLDLSALADALNENTVLVSVMLVNNETGALYDIAAISRLLRENAPSAVLHCDATQGFLKLPLSVRTLGIDLLTLSAHKVHGPKGIGALYISDAVHKSRGLSPIILGGGQEDGYRSGTVNAPALLSFAAAVKDGYAALDQNAAKMRGLRDALVTALATDDRLSAITPVLPAVCAPHILSLTLPSIKSETMLNFLSGEGFAISAGSACASHGKHQSPALLAYGLTPAAADTTVRVSFSHENTEAELSAFIEALAAGIARLCRIRK